MNKTPNMSGLKNFDSITGKEQGTKGGKASGKARREKKLLKDCLQGLLDSEITIDNLTMTGAEHIALKLFDIALNSTNEHAVIKAFTLIRDTVGEKPIEKISMQEIDKNTIDEVEALILEIQSEKTA